jgi:predicted DNA-binding transcriptional regulator AlpA
MENDVLLTADETAELLKLPNVKALYWLNYTKQGPPARRLGRELRYLRSDVLAYIASLPAA